MIMIIDLRVFGDGSCTLHDPDGLIVVTGQIVN